MKREDKRLKPLIIICGCYAGRGREILEGLGEFLRGLGINACTVSQLYPVPVNASGEQKRASSSKALRKAAGALSVAFSPTTLGVPPGAVDVVGGWAFEEGLLYDLEKEGLKVPLAVLYDGEDMVCNVSGMLIGWACEAIAEKGNLRQLEALALHLCRRLLLSA